MLFSLADGAIWPAFFILPIYVFFLGYGLWYILIDRPRKCIRDELESKIYFLIQKLNCSKEEARKILKVYKWDCDKIDHLIKKYSKKTCPSCDGLTFYTNKFCIGCGHSFQVKPDDINCYTGCHQSLDAKSLLKELSKNIKVKMVKEEISEAEYIPFKASDSNEKDDRHLIFSIEFFSEYLKILTLPVSSSEIQIPYNSLVSVSIYREISKKKSNISLQNRPQFKSLENNYNIKELYVCLIQTDDRTFEIVEGEFDFRKSLGLDRKLLFKENFKALIEKLYARCPQVKLNKGSLTLLDLK